MLRTRISSNIDVLNIFSEVYKFLPNENTIRPTLKILEKKYILKEHINKYWKSEKDFIKSNIFGFDTFIDNCNKINTLDKIKIDEWVFKECEFPYNTQCNHWILWKYSDTMNSFLLDNDNIININNIITENIQNIINGDNFDFGWYPNPKPSIFDFFHIHVFWTTL